jgi:Major tropism determinant N-terminal domain
MSQKIQVRRGADATRQTVTFDQGEPVWTTDTKKMYIGDGSTAGGISIGGGLLGDSFVAIYPESGSSKIANGTLLRNAIIDSKNKLPYNLPRSDTNRFSILLYPGVYASTGLSTTMPMPRYTNIIGIGGEIVIDTSAHSDAVGFYIGSGYVSCENFAFVMPAGGGIVLGLQDFDKPVTGIQFKNIVYSGDNATFLISQATNAEQILIDNVNPYLSTIASTLFSVVSMYNLKDVVIQNLDYVGSPFLPESLDDQIGYHPVFDTVILKNSKIKLKDYSYGLFSASGLINSQVINCQIESGIIFSPVAGKSTRVTNCQLLNTKDSDKFTFENCSFVRTAESVHVPVTISTSTYPSFYHCSFISTNGTTVVTGNAGTSGLFVNCIFNTPPFTGATGLFGGQGSRYDVRYR